MKNSISSLVFVATFCSNAIAQSWSLTSTFPDSYYPDQRNSGVYVTVGSKAYVGLGVITDETGFDFLGDFWEYDILCKGYVVSPQTTDDPFAASSKAVVEYNPTNNTWSAIQSYPESLIRGAAWYVNGTLYAGLGNSSKIYSLPSKIISGDYYVCSSETFTIINPSNYPVQWTKSPNLTITVNEVKVPGVHKTDRY